MSDSEPTYIYILSEDDNDDLFYEMCASRISKKSFYRVEPRRIRKNGGLSAVRKALKPFLNDLKGAENLDAYFVIALDNDRAPDHHSNHDRIAGLSNQDLAKQCRICEIERAIKGIWGQDVTKWPVQGAIAVPIEMLESWLLLSLNAGGQLSLPIFSQKEKFAAINFHGNNPPDQLKDLLNKEQENSNIESKAEFILQIAEDLDLQLLANSSPSFHHFQQQVLTW